MPKSIPILPDDVRKSGSLAIPAIPLMAYQSNPVEEARRFGSRALTEIYADMVSIREFETMLQSIKIKGEYAGLKFEHKGPCHLSIGQEAAAVGMAFSLTAEDEIWGSHRSHGEILAKGFSALRKLDEKEIPNLLKNYGQGRTFSKVEAFSKGSISEFARDYILYGTLAEIFGRDAGFNRGLGGSMHAFFPPLGIMPNNAIVGGSAALAVGAALNKRIKGKGGIVIANIGDAAAGCGVVWEAMNFAAMDQYRNLWDAKVGGAPPILFNFMNNFYGMGGQTAGETMGFGMLARLGAGVNEKNMHAERIDGYWPLALADAMERKRGILELGQGPVLLDTVTYRLSGHSPSDASSYRDREEMEAWKNADAIEGFGKYLVLNKHCSDADLERMRASAKDSMIKALEHAGSLIYSPRINPAAIGSLMFSWGQSEMKGNLGDTPDNTPNRNITMAEAIGEAVWTGFQKYPTLIAYGEENRDWGGAFSVYRGLTEKLPYHRLFNAPISEAAIVGTAVGYALSGGKVLAEIMYCDFLGRAGDEIFNQMAKWQAMSGGNLSMPFVLRVSIGSKYGAQHSQDWTALLAHIPGLRIFYPATPFDAKGMMNLALRGTDPVVFLESQKLYGSKENFEEKNVPLKYYEVEMGRPALRRIGKDLTIVTVGPTIFKALEAAQILSQKYGIEVEIIDARFINPLDYSLIVESVMKTHALLLASDACERGSFLHTMASHLGRQVFDFLDAPIVVIGARNWITPPAEMEEEFFPQKETILDAIHENIRPLPGHNPTTSQSYLDLIERARLGN